MASETVVRRKVGWGASAVIGSALGALIVYLIRRNGRGKQPVYPVTPVDPPPGGGVELDAPPERSEPPVITFREIPRDADPARERELQPVG